MLLNHDAVISALFCETDRAQRMRTPLSLVYFGLDEPGELVSRFGAAVFEKAVVEAARRVSRILRCYDSLGRMDEAELLILLPGCTAPNAVTFAERLRTEEYREPLRFDGLEIKVSACFGVTESGGRSPLVVVREAQQAFQMARAKEAGTVERCRIIGSVEMPFIRAQACADDRNS